VLFSGISFAFDSSSNENSSLSRADDVYYYAKDAYEEQNYRSASEFFSRARLIYEEDGKTERATDTGTWKLRSDRMLYEFPYNRTTAKKVVAEAYPNASGEVVRGWLAPGVSQQIVSDGEILYFQDTVKNIMFHNLDLIREISRDKGRTPTYDNIKNVALLKADSRPEPYRRPVTYEGTGNISIPRDRLPIEGLLRFWIPLPVETDSQVNVTIFSVEPAKYIKKAPKVNGDIGVVYLEIPLEGLKEDLNFSVRFRFTEYEQHFAVDTAQIGPYDKDSDLYRKYTSSHDNIIITPDIERKARSIVGNETNPYLQARMIYRYITETLPYSHVPHIYLNTAEIPESLYVHETGFGDCGTQSMYFCALCRALGIPARTIGGWQLIPGMEGPHLWAEFFLQDYGWIPVDVTVAESADWSFDASQGERTRFKDFYFANLDAYRFIIQKDVDVHLDPDPGDVVIFTTAHQYPVAVCNSSEYDLDNLVTGLWNYSFFNRMQ